MRFHKMIIPFFTTFFLLAILGTFSLYAEEELIKGKPILTGEAYQIENLTNDWSDHELWVWTQISKGEIADFNKRYGIVLDPKKIDPEKPEEWPESRILTLEFLETILLREPFRGALTHHGVRIIGAWFEDKIDLSNATLVHPLQLKGSRFDKDVNLNFLRTPFLISLNGSKFNGKLNMQALQSESNLSMSIYDTELEEAEYEAKFAAEFEEVNLESAKIEGQLNMIGSIFNGKLDMDSLQVNSYLFMKDNAEFKKEVNLLNAKIGSALEMDGSTFTGKLNMQRLEVANNLYMRYGAEFADVILSRAKIEGNLELSGSKFKSFSLIGTNIGREFRLSSRNEGKITNAGPAKWRKESKLTLLNTKVGVLQDSISSWPKYLKVELKGFTYDRLGNFIADNNKGLVERDIAWFKKWLGKQKKFTPQPYEHLASVLQKLGHESMANSVLYTGRERKRNEMATGINWLGLTILKWGTGYGYGYRIFFAVGWVLLLVGIGMGVLRFSKRKLRYCGFAYSLDLLLPIIQLRKYHYDSIEFEGWVKVYFYFHKIFGYVLALIIITGLSGIVK